MNARHAEDNATYPVAPHRKNAAAAGANLRERVGSRRAGVGG